MKASVCIERVDLQLRGGRRSLWTGKLCRLFDVPRSDVVLTEATLATAHLTHFIGGCRKMRLGGLRAVEWPVTASCSMQIAHI